MMISALLPMSVVFNAGSHGRSSELLAALLCAGGLMAVSWAYKAFRSRRLGF